MDPTKYKSIDTSRGFTYRYYVSPAHHSKPTLFFCHGFPSLGTHWAKVAGFFEKEGYGVIVPDMLGYGGTSKPLDTKAYLSSGLTKDAIEILDAETVDKAIAIGHDWGSLLASRLANHYPERFIAYAYFAVPYVPLTPAGVTYEQMMELSKARFGYELYGYWPYLASYEVDADFRKDPDTVFSIIFPRDPESWKTTMTPLGALKSAVRSGMRTPLPSYMTEEDKKEFIDNFMENGFAAPGRWYDAMIKGLRGEDDSNVPKERAFPPVTAPIFFGAAKRDYICVVRSGYELFASEPLKNHNVTIREFDGDHWVIISHADQINKELKSWIEETVLSKSSL